MFPSTIPTACGLPTCIADEPCYECDQPHDICQCPPEQTRIQRQDLEEHLDNYHTSYARPPQIKYEGNYATLNGQQPLRIVNLQTLTEIGTHLPQDLKPALFDAHLKATGQNVQPQPPQRLTTDTLKALLTGGLDHQSELGIILPAYGDSGLVWGSTATGKSRFLRWITTHHLTTPEHTATVLLGEDLTGWAAWALHHHQQAIQDHRLTLIDWVGKGPIIHPETQQRLALELSPPKGGVKRLQNLADGNRQPQTDLLVVDPASRFVEDEDRKIEVVAFWETLAKLFPTSRRVVAHHATKSRENPTPSGSAEWGNSPAVIWHLKAGADSHQLVTTKRRSGNLPDKLTYRTQPWDIRLDSREDQIQAYEDKLVAAIRQLGEPATLTTIRRNADFESVTDTILQSLTSRGILAYSKRAGSKYGAWSIPERTLPDPY